MTDILNLPGFLVREYRFMEEIGIVLYLENQQSTATCPTCGANTDKLHQNHELTVRDIAWGDQKIYLRVNCRQMRCDNCGKKFREELSLVKKKRRYTERFNQKIVQEVLESDIRNVARRNSVSEQEIETILKELGAELCQQKPIQLRKLGIDEIAVIKGQGNYYVVLVDLEAGMPVGFVEKRTEEAVANYLQTWGEEVLSQVQEVSIDLWKPYKNVVEKFMPQAIVVADRFHVMKQITQELDNQRKKLKRQAVDHNKPVEKEPLLAGLTKSKYALLKNEEDLTAEQKTKLEQVKKVAPNLGAMHQFKEQFREIFEASSNWVEGLLSLGDWLRDAGTYGNLQVYEGQ